MRIAIDCGHGSNTAGKRTPALPFDIDFENDGKIDIKKGGTLKEHIANVRVGNFLVKELERCGFDVYKSAFGDTDISIADRQKNIRNAKCDLSVSIHFNAYGDGKNFNDVQGLEIFYHSNKAYIGDSRAFANKVLNRLLEGTKQKNRGIKTQGLGLCNCSYMNTKASILVELGFMSNLEEAKLMGSDSFLKECAVEIAKGICDYTKRVYIPENQTTEESSEVKKAKLVKVIVDQLNVRRYASWNNNAIHSTVKKNDVFTVVNKVKVGSGEMYKLKSGLYITANKKYVTII